MRCEQHVHDIKDMLKCTDKAQRKFKLHDYVNNYAQTEQMQILEHYNKCFPADPISIDDALKGYKLFKKQLIYLIVRVFLQNKVLYKDLADWLKVLTKTEVQ
eukprot:280191_1